MKGAEDSIFAIGDCTATSYAPTAQVASQQGAYLARQLHQMAKRDELEEKLDKLESLAATVLDNEEKKKALREAELAKKQLAKIKLRPFEYSHQGSLAYIGSEKAIADLPFMNGNVCCLTLYPFSALTIVTFPPSGCYGWCRDIPLLAQCLSEYIVLPS